jgi:hypothetical protein
VATALGQLRADIVVVVVWLSLATKLLCKNRTKKSSTCRTKAGIPAILPRGGERICRRRDTFHASASGNQRKCDQRHTHNEHPELDDNSKAALQIQILIGRRRFEVWNPVLDSSLVVEFQLDYSAPLGL